MFVIRNDVGKRKAKKKEEYEYLMLEVKGFFEFNFKICFKNL